MLSRVAKNIYWIARYIERAENTARLINVNSNLLLDLPTSITFGWQPLISIMGCNELFYERYKELNERNVANFLIGDSHNSSSILSSLVQARENMRTTRDIIPTQAWEQLNNLYLFVKSKVAHGITKHNRYEFLSQIILDCQKISGIANGTMSRDAAYGFLRLGSHLERADMTTRILDVRSANLLSKQDYDTNVNLTPFYNIQWMSVLKSLTAYQMYRQHIRLRVTGEDVLRFLLQDHEFPRAVAYCLGVVERCLNILPKNQAALQSLAALEQQVQTAKVLDLAYQGLHEFIDDLQIGLGNVHNQITATYFAVETSQQSQSQAQTV